MSMQIAVTSQEPIDVLDWIETRHLSGLVASFARVHILLSVFDGDPDKWLQLIAREGSAEEREHDVPFLLRLKYRMQYEPELIVNMRHLLGAFSSLVAGTPLQG